MCVYRSPQIVRRTEYEGKPVDIWSLGVLLYALLFGCFPFRAKSYPDLYRRIARGTFTIPDDVSPCVRDLLLQLLEIDADRRITASYVLRHPWLQTCLIHTPDMKKLRLEIPFLISDRASDDINDEVIKELEKFGLPSEELIRLILSKLHSSMTTLYYLLLDIVVKNNKKKAIGNIPHTTTSSSSTNHNNNNSNSNNNNNNIASIPLYKTTTHPSSSSSKSQNYNPSSTPNNTNNTITNNMKYSSSNPTLRTTNTANTTNTHTRDQQQPIEYGNIARPKSSSNVTGIRMALAAENSAGNTLTMNMNGIRYDHSNTGTGSNNIQRPLSAYAGRR